jgi:hypothetical protein
VCSIAEIVSADGARHELQVRGRIAALQPRHPSVGSAGDKIALATRIASHRSCAVHLAHALAGSTPAMRDHRARMRHHA